MSKLKYILLFVSILFSLPLMASAERFLYGENYNEVHEGDEIVFDDQFVFVPEFWVMMDEINVAFHVYNLDKSSRYTDSIYFDEVGLTDTLYLNEKTVELMLTNISQDPENPWAMIMLTHKTPEPTNYQEDLSVTKLDNDEIGETYAFLKWSSNLPCIMKLSYYNDGQSQSGSTQESQYVKNHTMQLNGLTAGTTYYYTSACSADDGKRVEFNMPSSFTTMTATENETISNDDEDETENTTPTQNRNSEGVMERERSRFRQTNGTLVRAVKGKILLQVEENGEAWYLNPQNEKRYYLGRPENAFEIMRETGLGITDSDLEKIPLGIISYTGTDTDSDGLPDALEEAIGTDPNLSDTDGDGFSDYTEVSNDFNPKGVGKLLFDTEMSSKLQGRIMLQVQKHGEAWYINPDNNRRYFLGRPADAFQAMRTLGLGISNNDLNSIPLE